VPLPKIEREEMRFLTPTEILDLAEAIHARYRVLVFVGAYGGLRIGELAGLRPSRVDLRAEAVTRGVVDRRRRDAQGGRRAAGTPRSA
jgi:integrase